MKPFVYTIALIAGVMFSAATFAKSESCQEHCKKASIKECRNCSCKGQSQCQHDVKKKCNCTAS